MRKICASFLLGISFANLVFADDVFIEDIVDGCMDYGYMAAIYEPNQHTCSPGYYMPAGYDGCMACPSDATCAGGTFAFNETMAQGIVYDQMTQNISYGCAADFPLGGFSVAIFEPNQHTCSVGYYMPAGYDGCLACPSDATCAGGTFAFNETMSQGIVYEKMTQNIPQGCAVDLPLGGFSVAIFEPTVYTCNPGYYLPANTDGCVICPANSYCPGGAYTFNENDIQGITACATGLYAPMGMWQVDQCGHILHIGEEIVYLRTTKKTLHALHIDVDHDGIADYFGNMTTADVPMHAGTTQKLKVQFAGQTYSVYDDTVNPDE